MQPGHLVQSDSNFRQIVTFSVPMPHNFRMPPSHVRSRHPRGRIQGHARSRAQAAAMAIARVKTSSSMGSVSRPVNVFCWLTW